MKKRVLCTDERKKASLVRRPPLPLTHVPRPAPWPWLSQLPVSAEPVDTLLQRRSDLVITLLSQLQAHYVFAVGHKWGAVFVYATVAEGSRNKSDESAHLV